MKTPKINYFLVGVFVLACVAGLLTMVALMSGRSGPMEGYFSTYGNVAGLKDGAQVLYEGYPVGEVTGITPKAVDGGMTFRVDYGVQAGWQIPQDSVARIASNGLLSAITINIEAGTSPVAVKIGTEVSSSESGDLFAVMANVATTLSDVADSGVRPLLGRLLHYVDSIGGPLEQNAPELMAELRQVVNELHAPINRIEESMPVITGNLESFTEQLKATGDRVDGIVSDRNIQSINGIIANVNRLTRDLNDTRATLDKVMNSANSAVGSAERMMTNADKIVSGNKGNIDNSLEDLEAIMRTTSRNIDSITRNLDITSRNLKEFSRQIRENPGLLMSGSAQPE